jgi:hypothetical protein
MKGAHDRDLRFQFIQAVPSHTQQYTAVSYTWANVAQTETIYVDGQPLRIKPNLWACLYTLSRHGWQYIWADAVCINQDDIAEKNQQVRMMDRIYQNATVVSVWLGHPPLPGWLNVPGPIVTLETDDFDWAEAMEDLANRPYWRRSWTIQEYMLAREIHVYCSNSRVDGVFFQDLLSRAAGVELLEVQDDELAAQPDLVRKWAALPMNVGRHVDRMPYLYQPLYDLLIRHVNAQSTDPRDKIFALLGLVPLEERSFLLRSFPNYNLTMEQVNTITIAHAQAFAIGQPLEPIFRALRIPKGRDRRRLLQILGRMDYTGADDPADEVARISTYLLPHMDEELEAAGEEDVFDSAGASDMARGRYNVSRIMKCFVGALVSIPLLYVVVIHLWQFATLS